MATVTGLTANRMLAIEAASVVDGDVDASGNLILTKHDGSQINAGSVIGPQGPQGPVGSMLPVVISQPVLDIGLANQIRAGRQLTAADFTNMGLAAPLGLWNLSDLSDVSGNGRSLLNKGATPFAAGINGIANTAVQFVGSPTQALYIAASGPSDPFKIKNGSFGAWMRTAKRGTAQAVITMWGTASGSWNWWFGVGTNVAQFNVTNDGVNVLVVNGVTDICDNRWHFICVNFDSSLIRLYVDGMLDSSGATASGIMFGANTPLNIGGSGADASTNSGSPHCGRIDEVFITGDILSEEQMRNLYCAKISHTLGLAPSRVSLNVRRYRRAQALGVADFPTPPLRLYNFSGGSFGDEGSQNSPLTNNAAVSVAGVDGSAGNAFSFKGPGPSLIGSDTGLPTSGPRSFGCWFKTVTTGGQIVMQYGSTTFTGIFVGSTTAGCLDAPNGGDTMHGPFVSDGLWHHVVITEYNAVGPLTDDGIKRKMYLDGKLVATSTVMNNVVSGGFNYLRIADNPGNTSTFTGQIDGVFVCDYALKVEDVFKLYAKSSQPLSPSPKNAGDHVEALATNNLLVTFDTLDSTAQVDIGVAA